MGDARTVLNVGAGTGSYEPHGRQVIAVEPSSVMVAQRSRDAAPVVQARAESLLFANASFDAVLGVLTLHHWSDVHAGLRECARVARGRVVLFTYERSAAGFWLTQDYLPEFLALDRAQFPPMETIGAAFGSSARVESTPVPIPRDCVDGFLGAFWARPAAYLDPRVRAAISSFARFDTTDGLARLKSDLADGTWGTRYGQLLDAESLDIGYRLVVAHASGVTRQQRSSPAL